VASLHLKIITPSRIVEEEDIHSLSAPTVDGDVTILPRHTKYFSLLKEGIVKFVTKDNKDDYLAIGGGYIETDGKHLTVLVSRAYGQNDIDEQLTKRAMEQAEKTLRESKDTISLQQARTTLRRSVIDMKLLKRRKNRSVS
jgi:F-type H+-transporting ATPase subunit epsilon